jgi:hypothetical protein
MTRIISENSPARAYFKSGGPMDLNNSHIGEDDLESYSMRALANEAVVRVELHLLICETCRERLMAAEEAIAIIRDAARELPRRERIRERQRWSFPRLIPAFAALAFLAIAAVTLPLVRRGPPAAPFAVTLQTMRGPASRTAPSRRPLLLGLDLTGLAASPSYRVEVVDRSGDRVWHGTFNGSGAIASVAIPPQKRGTYFVRVALPSGETLREYGLEIRGTD